VIKSSRLIKIKGIKLTERNFDGPLDCFSYSKRISFKFGARLDSEAVMRVTINNFAGETRVSFSKKADVRFNGKVSSL
jgi:hypothetical protein